MRNEIFTVIDDISINLTNLNGKTIDISRLLLQIEIYESVFEPFMSGKLVIADTLDIQQNFPIIGYENLEISLSTTDINRTIVLNQKIYKIARDTQNIKGDIKRRILIIYFCSEEKILSNLNSISKKYNDKAENIIQDALDIIGSEKTFDYISTTDNLEIFSNFWSPQKLIEFVCKLSTNGTYSDYLFFENFDGFSFKPISHLLNQEHVHDVVYDTRSESFIGNKNMKIFRFENYFDINMNSGDGLFGMTLYKPGLTEYSYEKNASDLHENVEDIVTNGLSLPFNDNVITSENFIGLNYYDPDISKIRMTSLKLLKNYNIVAKMNGDFIRKCGQILNLDFPNYDNENNINTSFDGKWFIMGIKHIIGQDNNFEQNLFLGKNSFFNNSALHRITNLVNI